jgi:mono/diheme cytochrome c family protein
MTVSAPAFDNLDKGKTAPQLFKTNCAICHRSAQGLGAQLGGWSLPAFLAQHYTTSKAAADQLAAYLMSVNRAGARETRPQRRRAAPR